jgi:hypothetical protein
MAGYTRQAAANIATGSVIDADDFNDEYNQIQSAFNASTGHNHDGTAAEGAPIEKIGPSQDIVATASVLRPKTTNAVDLGTTALQYKDAFFDGTVRTDTLTVDENATIAGNLTVTGTMAVSLAADSVGASQISANAVGSSEIAADAVGASEIAANAVGASELNVSGNGSNTQFLRSDGDGTFTWAVPSDTNTNTTYSAGNGLSLSGTTFTMSGSYSGSFTATGNITAYSDERLKENVETIEGALDKVSQMRGVTYNYKSDLNDGQRGTGVIAQEMQQVMPEVVEEGEYLSVAYGNIVGVLIEAVKELKEELDQCKCKKCECA